MTEPDDFPRHLPLYQSVTRDGMTVRVEIYEVGEDGWLLEVVDDYGILRFYNYVNHTFNTDPASFEPIFWRDVQWGAAKWSEGFIAGFMFNEAEWSLLSMGQPTWFTPFLRLGVDADRKLTHFKRMC
jgi:hypothetical protein